MIVTVGLLALVAGRLVLRPVPGDWAYALIAAIVGPAVEAAISAAGAFDYADPDFAGIPMWLPALWANGGLFIRRLLAPVVLDEASPVAQQDEPAERAHVGGAVGAERDRGVVVVEPEPGARRAACRPSAPLRKSIAVKYQASVPLGSAGFVYV